MSEQPILKVNNVKTHFDVTKGIFSPKQIVKAVDGVTFEVKHNETFGLVGESGCGKSTLGRTIVKLYEPVEGNIEFEGKDISKIKGDELKNFRKNVQMIFQDPYASLNPRMTVGEIIKEPMIIHNIYDTDEEREARAVELLKIVGLKPDHIRRYPQEFSGGQRQRIGVARALAVNPKFIVCDEPISALDVSIQAQVVNLLKNIQEEMGLSYLFIAHDLSMVKYISDEIGVMYLGHIVELGPSNDVYYRPLHPYTQALLSAIPVPDPDTAKSKSRIVLEGEIPSPINPPKGCPFCTRCSKATERCRNEVPVPVKVGERTVWCFLYEK
ncbi:MAG: dipeptide ABC transporter ATP-binding protein [Oscillospiraceae bacterium]|nr:dipeptide ABC transporter ATP-binding protein [Oscillospiraceae bacterium]MBR4929093.1 dipeptide ABC transporter ATP-binding protein [Oscillospiraceae bacterium]